MNTQIKLIAGLAAAVVIAVVGYNLLPRQGSNVGGSAPPPTASPAPGATAAATAVPSPDVIHATAFGVPLTLTLVDGWTKDQVSAGNIGLLRSTLQLDAGIMSIASLQVASSPTGALEPWPADFQAWLAAQPEFKPHSAIDVTVGGRPGVRVDVDVSLSAADSPREVLRVDGNNWKTVRTAERWRFIVVETGPGTGIVILMPSAVDSFDAAVASLDRIVATVQFLEPTASPSD